MESGPYEWLSQGALECPRHATKRRQEKANRSEESHSTAAIEDSNRAGQC